jgi:hypothetical protein
MTDLERIAKYGTPAIEQMADDDFSGQPVSPTEYREMGGTNEEYIEDMKATLPCWRELDADQYAIWHGRVTELVEEN